MKWAVMSYCNLWFTRHIKLPSFFSGISLRAAVRVSMQTISIYNRILVGFWMLDEKWRVMKMLQISCDVFCCRLSPSQISRSFFVYIDEDVPVGRSVGLSGPHLPCLVGSSQLGAIAGFLWKRLMKTKSLEALKRWAFFERCFVSSFQTGV